MSDIVSDLAARSGLTPEQTQKGLGTVLSFLKGVLPAETFAQVSAAVPGSDRMMAAAPREEPAGGLVGAIKGVAHKLLGGDGAAALLAKLSSLGISVEQAQAFLPRALEFLKGRLPDPVMNQSCGLLRVSETARA